MCKSILLVVDGTSSDRAMMEYVKSLAKLWQSRLILLHVENSEPRGCNGELHYPGATDAVEYMKKMQKEFQSADVLVELVLSYGEPVMEIKSQVQKKTCDPWW